MGAPDSSFQDVEIECMNIKDSRFRDCEGNFVWSRGEQNFLQRLIDEGKENRDGSPVTFTQPKRCKSCRLKKRQEREARGEK